MISLEGAGRPVRAASSALFALTVFTSAGLVFLVQPMVAKLVLPLLGGSPSVWNTSIAFFQSALLAGYLYAHLLQRIASVRIQAGVHLTALLAAALVLPLHITGALGDPDPARPALWLLGVLALSIGAPFAVLSATAPLVQAWHARTIHLQTGAQPYVLYAASNLGSLLALLAYPALVEPLIALRGQTFGWSAGYGAFVLLMAALAVFVSSTSAGAATQPPAESAAPTWLRRLTWVALAALPSSLMLGVTTHLTMDVASAPFLWVIPLALYLTTFIMAFADRPVFAGKTMLMFQAAAAAASALLIPLENQNFVLQFFIHLAAFFLTTLMCHHALVARRPEPARLTEFYLCMSLGGVLGGAFNAFVAPVIFTNVWEFPLALVLACLARPGHGPIRIWQWAVFVLGVAGCVAAVVLAGRFGVDTNVRIALGVAVVSLFLVRDRVIVFVGLMALLSVCANLAGDRVDVRNSWRSFFGVVRQSEMPVPGLGGQVKMLSHGTTLHGAQATAPEFACRPLTYYAPDTPIGQVFLAKLEEGRPLEIGAVGLGTGAVAAYTRPGDHMTFFEIDPLVVRIATDPQHFSYTTRCAQGRIDYVLGDARLTLSKQPAEAFDILLIDAFSSDAVPAHLLTVEAVRGYLERLKPDGVLILHLSNRNLDLVSPAMAVAYEAGGEALLQRYRPPSDRPALRESAEDALIIARSYEALARFAADPRWDETEPTLARPWRDDYVNLVGALYTQMKDRWTWLP
ncbi:MAG: spermidine synthase [Phenylobacterium sp.]|uniref:spermidine synthase n=1 Tax=Phenylobacterium sp. TaxID=1871053 RepID=UPI00391DECE6